MKTRDIFLLLILSLPLFSQTKVFIREYTYTAGEADSKITSRAIALDQVKRILLEEIGVYLQSEMITTKEEKNEVYNELTKQQIQSITAGITETKIVEEKWNGEQYYIKASITVDPDEVNKNIARIGADQSKLKELVEVKRKADEALGEIERLRKELAVTKSENDKLTKQKEYNTASNILSASDWFQKGYNAHELKEYDNAILYTQKAIELNPQDFKTHAFLGIIYQTRGALDKAIQAFEKSIELNSHVSEVYSVLGATYEKKDNLDKAIQCYETAIKLNPKDYESNLILGNVYAKKGDLDKAIQCYESAIKLNSKNSNAYYFIANIYRNAGDFEKAIQYLEKAIEFNSNAADYYFSLGGTYVLKANFDKAIQSYKKGIELNPNDANLYWSLGAVYGLKNDFDKAIQLYEKAIVLNPEIAEVYNLLGYTFYKKNNFNEAILCYAKAIKLNPDDAEVYRRMGIVYAELTKISPTKQNLAKVIQYFKKAALLGDKPAQEILIQQGAKWESLLLK